MKKLILFDFDGTVIDNSEGIFNCIKYSLNKLGIPVPDEKTLRRFVGPSLDDSFCRYIQNDISRAKLFTATYRERYAPIGHTECVLYSGIKETLQNLRDTGFITAVCSGKPIDFVSKIVKLLNIEDLFSGLYCPGFANCSSNKAELILQAVKDFGVTKEETLMIGDTVFDIRSAKEAGVQSLGVLYGFSEPGELKNEGADFIARSPKEIYSEIVSKGRCAVFGAGEYEEKAPDTENADYVIAADGGYKKCLEFNITPDLFIGDFDSLEINETEVNCPVIKLPVQKDVTDTYFSVEEAIKKGYLSFDLYGCLGGREDHTFANISLLKSLSQKGIKTVLHGKGYSITAVTDGTVYLPEKEAGYVSVFAISEKCEGVTIKGLKYNIEKETLYDTFALGVSNEYTGNEAYIGVTKGTLMIVY